MHPLLDPNEKIMPNVSNPLSLCWLIQVWISMSWAVITSLGIQVCITPHNPAYKTNIEINIKLVRQQATKVLIPQVSSQKIKAAGSTTRSGEERVWQDAGNSGHVGQWN